LGYIRVVQHAENPQHGQAHLVFADTQSQRWKTKRACPYPPLTVNYSNIFYTVFRDIKSKLISLAT